MATQPDDLPEGEVEQLDAPAQDVVIEPTNDDEPSEPSPIEALALEMGWKPKGDVADGKWKPADEWIRDGQNLLRERNSDLRSLQSTVDTIARTNAQILQDRLAEQKAQLTQQYNEAVEEGDASKAFKIGQQINTVEQRATEPAAKPEVDAWAAENKSWFNVDPLATSMAIEVCNKLANRPVSEQLAAAKREVARNYPELFPQQKPAPGVSSPQSRTAAESKGPKGFKDLPPAAQKVGRDLHERGLIPTTEAYAVQYWKEAGK